LRGPAGVTGRSDFQVSEPGGSPLGRTCGQPTTPTAIHTPSMSATSPATSPGVAGNGPVQPAGRGQKPATRPALGENFAASAWAATPSAPCRVESSYGWR